MKSGFVLISLLLMLSVSLAADVNVTDGNQTMGVSDAESGGRFCEGMNEWPIIGVGNPLEIVGQLASASCATWSTIMKDTVARIIPLEIICVILLFIIIIKTQVELAGKLFDLFKIVAALAVLYYILTLTGMLPPLW